MADEAIVTETYNDKKVRAESDFISSFSDKLGGDEGIPSGGTAETAGPVGTATATAAEDPATQTTLEDPATAGSGTADAGSDQDGQDAGETTQDLGGDGLGTAAEGAEAAVDERFREAMERHGGELDLATLPAGIRPVVEKKIKNLEAGFTRAMQEVRAGQKASQQDQAELRFQRERPADFIVAQLLANPEIAEAVNAKLEEMERSTMAREHHGVIVEHARASALKAVEAEQAAKEQQAQRSTEVERIARAAADAYAVPFDFGVEDKVAAHVAIHGDIDEPTIRRIAKEQATKYQAIVRAQTREQSKTYVQQKVADRRTAGLTVKPGSGMSPQPAGRAKPSSDDEFIAEFASRL